MFDARSLKSHTKISVRASKVGLCGRLLVLLAVVLLSTPLLSSAQTSQTVSLEEGWNFVSLHVQPEDPSFASIFDDTSILVSVVKNGDGKVYLPDQGIEQITSWQVDQGYQVYAETSSTFSVTGSRASASTAIVLDEGWNLVPFLPTESLAPAEALVSIEESLEVVEDEGGRQYEPSGSSSPLDSLHPGQGYKVYVERADTLQYPTVVNTLDNALALSGMEIGHYIRVQGYNQPGDGGGGLFRVTDSGSEIDGGTVFAFDEDVSAQQSVDINNDRLRGVALPDSDLVFGSVEVQIGQSKPNQVADTKFLHGHAKNNPGTMPFLEHKAGAFNEVGYVWFNARQYTNSTGFTVRYKHATSDRRLERLGVTNAFSIDWWGAKEADPNDPVNNWWRIAWAANKAYDAYQNGNYDWAYVDIPGHYYYRYMIRIPEGVKLRGTSDQTFGNAANGRPTHGKLTLMPGMAMNHIKNGWADDHILDEMEMAAQDLTHAKNAVKFGAESLEVDGNIPNNMGPIINNDTDYGPVISKLQNGNNWNGFMSKNTGSWETPDGAEAHFNDVYVHGFPGNGFGMNNAYDFSPSSNVRVGDAPRNHQLYRTNGVHDSWTIDESGWASILKVTRGTFTNLTINVEENTLYDYWGSTWFKVFDHHGKGFGLEWDADSERIASMKIDVDDFSVDVRDQTRSSVDIFADKGYGGTYKNGVIETTTGPATTLLVPVFSGNGPIRDYTYEDITVNHHGGGVSIITLGGPHTHFTFKNVTIQQADGISESSNQAVIKPRIFDPEIYAEYNGDQIARHLGMAARLELINVDMTVPTDKEILSVAQTGGMAYDLFIKDSSFDNTTSDAAQGIIKDPGPDSYTRYRAYLDNVTLNVYYPLPGFRHKDFHTYTTRDNPRLRLRDCQDRNGRVSDESGTYTSGASDEGNDYVLIPTSLMTLAQERTATVTTGSRTVQSVENADSNGNVLTFDPNNPQAFDPRDPYLRVNLDAPLGAGETVAVDWTARVTPLADYQTTGVFIARPVADQTYATGAGPWTLDLRGVAASQESKEPIQYTATSSNISVVTATVNSYENTDDNLIPWELELTEQGTGTATITIDADIPGVGTETTTFEVTVE
jgi:hypothetical protein